METKITEIAPDIYRLCTYIQDFNLQFNQFVVKDDESLLFHTGMKQLFPMVHQAVGQVIEPSQLRWISFSHYEPDECGALNEWLQVAPQAQAICSEVGAAVFVNDAALRPAQGLKTDQIVQTGKRRFRFIATPHLPHGWDAGFLFEETTQTLFCSDLFHQLGDVEPTTEADVVGRSADALKAYQAMPPFNDYLPFTPLTERHLARLGMLKPRACATMHGSTFIGNGQGALGELGVAFKKILGSNSEFSGGGRG